MWPWFALVLATFLTSTAGQECHQNFTIHATDNTTKLFDSCTTIVGNVYVDTSFDGDLYLRGIYNISGSLEFQPDHVRTQDHDSRPVVHWFNAPDLLHLGELNIHEGFSVYEFDLLALETIGNMSIYVDEYALNLRLGRLVEAESINISRALSTVDLNSLKTVYGAIIIDYHKANSSSNEPDSSNHGIIDFPALQSAGSLNFAGATKNITLPKLSTVGPSPGPSSSETGLTLNLEKFKNRFDLNLPKLQSVADQVNIYGKVKEIHAPQLANFTSVNVTSSTTFDCDSFIAAMEQTSQYAQDGSSVNCTFTPSKGLSKGAKVAIGVVIPVVVITIVVAVVLVWMKKKARRETRARMELRAVPGVTGMDSRRAETPPPPYSSHGR